MHVDRGLDTMLAQGFANQRANSQIRHIVIIHDIKMHDIRTSGENVIHLFTEAREIG